MNTNGGGCLYILIRHDHPFIQLYFIAHFTGFHPFISNDFSIFIQYHPSVQNFTEHALPVLRTVVVGATIVVGATVLVALGMVRVCSLTTDGHGWPRIGGRAYFLGWIVFLTTNHTNEHERGEGAHISSGGLFFLTTDGHGMTRMGGGGSDFLGGVFF